MSDQKDDSLVIAAERIGLPTNATNVEIAAAIYKQAERIKQLEEAVKEVSTMAEARKMAEERLTQVMAENVVAEAVRNQWIDKHEEKYYIEDYIANPTRTTERINDRKYRGILGKVVSLRDQGSAMVDIDAEVAAKASELMASDEKFRGKPGAAQLEVLKRDNKLSERHREKHVQGVTKGGGG